MSEHFFFGILKFIPGRNGFRKNIVHEVKQKDDWCSVAGQGLRSVNIGLFVSRNQERIVFVDDE
jgi:hypothetical protein